LAALFRVGLIASTAEGTIAYRDCQTDWVPA
jgi:hypothetical protein